MSSLLAEVIADVAGGWQLRKRGLFRYLIQPGQRLRHDCVARASRESAIELLARFLPPLAGRTRGGARRNAGLPHHRQGALAWRSPYGSGRTRRRRSATFTSKRVPKVAVRRAPSNFWTKAGRSCSTPCGTRLQAHPDRRRQDRLRYDRPVVIQTVVEGEAPQTIHARARNLSRTGMGLFLPVKPSTRQVVIYLSPDGEAAPTAVLSRLVRLEERDGGYDAGALFLGGEG